MPSYNANNIQAADRIARHLTKQGYNVKVSKPKTSEYKYVISTEGKKKKKGNGRVRATFKSSVI